MNRSIFIFQLQCIVFTIKIVCSSLPEPDNYFIVIAVSICSKPEISRYFIRVFRNREIIKGHGVIAGIWSFLGFQKSWITTSHFHSFFSSKFKCKIF